MLGEESSFKVLDFYIFLELEDGLKMWTFKIDKDGPKDGGGYKLWTF